MFLEKLLHSYDRQEPPAKGERENFLCWAECRVFRWGLLCKSKPDIAVRNRNYHTAIMCMGKAPEWGIAAANFSDLPLKSMHLCLLAVRR